MHDTAIKLKEARTRLLAQTFQERWDYRALATHLESLASMFARINKDEHRELIAQFHDCAGKFPYIDDCDYGALVLEKTAEEVSEKELRAFLLIEARFRATWCVQGATAGGEAIARAVHLRRLEEKIKNAEM